MSEYTESCFFAGPAVKPDDRALDRAEDLCLLEEPPGGNGHQPDVGDRTEYHQLVHELFEGTETVTVPSEEQHPPNMRLWRLARSEFSWTKAGTGEL